MGSQAADTGRQLNKVLYSMLAFLYFCFLCQLTTIAIMTCISTMDTKTYIVALNIRAYRRSLILDKKCWNANANTESLTIL